MNDETLDVLPGEGETRTIHQVRQRAVCNECGKPAHYQQTYILKGARSDPRSSAYGKDDISWCSDLEQFFCREHKEHGSWNLPDGYIEGGLFYANHRFAHLFLKWEEVK